MYAAFLACISLDRCVLVHDLEFVAVGRDGEVLDRSDSYDGEERSFGFPAHGASTSVVVKDIPFDSDSHWVGSAVAFECAAVEA